MSLRGFWSPRSAKDKKSKDRLSVQPTPPPGRRGASAFPQGSWREHPDQATVERAESAQTHVRHK